MVLHMKTKILQIKVILFLLLHCTFITAVNSEDPICNAGEFATSILSSGDPSKVCGDNNKITTVAECIAAADYNYNNKIDKNNKGWNSEDIVSVTFTPPGCYHAISGWYFFNTDTTSTIQCCNNFKCICKTKTCTKCPSGTYQDETGSASGCKNCASGTYNTEQGQTSCKTCEQGHSCANPSQKEQQICPSGSYQDETGSTGLMENMRSLSSQQGGIIKAVALSNAKSNEVKQKANGLIAKLSLDWATQDVINEAQILRDQLSKLPEYNVFLFNRCGICCNDYITIT